MLKIKKIKKWVDGDSGIFTDGTSFRLRNVRAPEKKSKGGRKAQRVAAGMTGRSKGRVSVKIYSKDKYGRQIVEMSNKDGSINKRMREKGYINKGR